MTIQEAAEFLNVSQTYFETHILDKTNMPSHLCAKQRKVYFRDVLAYVKHQKIETDKIMADLAALSQKMGLME